MLLPDPTIDEHALAKLVAGEFGHSGTQVDFVPAGGDSWNYMAGPWWVSVRRDRQGHFRAAYEAASELREAGYAFVLAPARGRSGQVVFLLGGRPVVVSRFVEGTTAFPAGLSDAHKQQLLTAVAALHSAHVNAAVPRETFDLPFDDELDAALARVTRGADTAGPLAADVSDLVRRNQQRITAWRVEIRELQQQCRLRTDGLVLTHGEPDPPNVMVTSSGNLLLLDWGDLKWAPAERDALGLANAGVVLSGRPEFWRFYSLRWILSEVAEYVARLTSPHVGNAEDHEKRRELDRYLSSSPPSVAR